MTELGWTFDEFRQCDFGYLMELHEYWLENPPVHLLIRNYLGYERQDTGMPSGTPEVNAVVLNSLGRRAGKLKHASEAERKIFEMQKEEAKKKPKAKRGG